MDERMDANALADFFNETALLQDQHEEVMVFSNASDFSVIKYEYAKNKETQYDKQ